MPFIEEVEDFTPTQNNTDLLKTLQSVKISPLDEIKPPLVAWQMMNSSGDFDTVGHCGDFSVIIGKAKSRKSFLINIALCACVQDTPALGIIKSQLVDKTVLYFDTEQSIYYVQLAIKRICNATGLTNPNNLNVYALRKFTPSERLELIEYAIYNTPNIGFVVIDGIKDLVTSINDEEQATMIASKLLKWTADTNCHIVTVLHQNKGNDNARGHIGTELINKAETVLSVTKSDKQPEISIVEPQFTRSKEPDVFGFEIIDGLPVLAQDWKNRTSTERKKSQLEEIEDYRLYQLLNSVYSNAPSFMYSKLQIQIQMAYNLEFGKSLGNTATEKIIERCKNNKWIIQSAERKPYTLAPFLNNDDPLQ